MKNKFIVAIGSSAGGLSPMKSFFDSTPDDHVTYVVVRHISSDFQSGLHEILQRHSKLKIKEAEDNMLIEQNLVYVQPAAMYMTIKNDRLYLEPRSNHPQFPNWSKDIFLKSLSKAKGKMSIAIILSGGGTDGSKGACSIKEARGMVIAQDPTSCEHPDMPKNAIQAGCVDYILAPEDMPAIISGYVNENFPNL